MLNNKEWMLIKKVTGNNNPFTGDDCAVWNEKNLVVTTDHMCENYHFDLSFMPPDSIGWRLMAANASDIISMGSKPTHCLLNIAAPREKTDIADGMIEGIRNFTDKYGIKIIGGDTTGADLFMIGATMFGEKPDKPLLRSGAKPGDFVYIATHTGLSKCGLLHLKKNTPGFELSKKKFLYPDPFETAPPSFEGINSAIDISDSLVSELQLLSKSSKVKIKINIEAIPVNIEVEKTAQLLKTSIEELILGSGEEFSLLFTTEMDLKWGHKIGKVYETKEPKVEIFSKDRLFNIDLVKTFDHFS